MATIYIDNLIKPREVNSPTTYPSKETKRVPYIYSDLHLDLAIGNAIGNGLNAANSNDIQSDYDSDAIRNSLFNIFTTRKGQKVLSPNFGGSFEPFLFEEVTDIKAKLLGNYILEAAALEPRIEVISVQVMPMPDQHQYYVLFRYKLLNIGNTDVFKINFHAHGVNIQ